MQLATLLSALSLASLALANPLLDVREKNTCALTQTTYVTTITTSAQPFCPTVTVTGNPPKTCTPLANCGPHPDCVLLKQTTVSCPAPCCPSVTPTKTAKAPCPTCQVGCSTAYETVTATCT